MTINRDRKGKRAAYRIQADREGVLLTVDEAFWDDTVLDAHGTTQLDHNITTVVQEIRAALYYVATDYGSKH